MKWKDAYSLEEVMVNLDSILKSRDISLPTKVHLVKALVFPVVMYGCESWTIKKAERQRIDGFELWCWRTLKRPSVCKTIQPVNPEGNKSWIFIGSTDTKAETPILWPPDAKNWLIGKYPFAGKDWRREEKGTTGWDGWKASLTHWTWVWVSSRSWWWTGKPGVLQSMGLQRVGHDWATELNWMFHCVYVPQLLYPFICRWTYRLLPDSAAAAAAKSLQSCPTLCDPIDGSPPGSPVPGILQARTLEWVAISFSSAWKGKVKVKSLSCVQFLVTPQTAAYQAPLPMGFSRQEYWSGLPLPSPSVCFREHQEPMC